MAGPIKLTEVDFEQIKQNLIDYLRSTKQFTDYDFAGSNLQVILNLISYQAQLNSYTANMVANESFLASASIRSNVVENANLLGYTPTSTRSAIVLTNIEIELDPLNYPHGLPTYVKILPGPTLSVGTGTGSYTFSATDSIVTGVVASNGKARFTNIELYEGNILEQRYEVNPTTFNQRYVLSNSRIDTSTIRVEVQEDVNEDIRYAYTEANNLTTLTSESRVYWIEETRDGLYELKFGDGYFGKKLEDGAKVTARYLVTTGSLANGIQDKASYRLSAVIEDSYGTTISTPRTIGETTMLSSGVNKEDVSSIKLRAPRSYEAQKRCVTETDYESLIRQIYPAVDDIYAYGGETLDEPEFGRVYVAVKPISGDRLSMVAKNYIKKSLEPYRIASLDIRFVDPEVVHVEMYSTIYFDDSKSNKDKTNISAAAKDAMARYQESTIVSKFGGTVRSSVIGSIINDAEKSITRNITTYKLRKDIRPLLNSRATYEICFVNPLELDCNNPVMVSSGFRMEVDGKDDGNLYYMEDDSNGNIRVFYYTDNFKKIYTFNYFGSINYETGDVFIGYDEPLKVIGLPEGEAYIKFTAIPRETDIVAKESVFLNLDLGSSRFDAIEDNSIAR